MTRQQILKYTAERFGTVSEHLWLRYPNYEVLRCVENGKWYGVVMDVPKYKIGQSGDDRTDILVIKGSEDDIPHIVGEKGFAPAYHMNKKHWFSVILADAEEKAVYAMIEKSYRMIKPSEDQKDP